MRVACLTDLHANLAALDAVLAALGPVDAVWVMGDIVGYGPDPDAVVARLRTLDAIAVRGNHDAAALGLIDVHDFNDDAARAALWTREQISPETRDWLAALPERREIGDFTLVHGSPRDPTWEYLWSAAAAAANLDAFTTRTCIVGHTHVPLVFRLDGRRMETIEPVDGTELVLDERRTFLNPGGVGQPRDGDPRACAMLLETETGTLTWRRIPWPIAETQARMREAGLPARLVERLAVGR